MSQTPEEPDHTADYAQALSDAAECLGDIEELEWKFPIGTMIDYARENGLPLSSSVSNAYSAPPRCYAMTARTRSGASPTTRE